MSVIPGSEGLWFVHACEKAGIRDRPSWVKSSHVRSSRLSNCMGTLFFKRGSHAMDSTTNQRSSCFLGAGPIGNRVHAKLAHVTDSGDILNQLEQIRSMGMPAKIPPRAVWPALERVQMPVEGPHNGQFNIARTLGVVHGNFNINIHA